MYALSEFLNKGVDISIITDKVSRGKFRKSADLFILPLFFKSFT